MDNKYDPAIRMSQHRLRLLEDKQTGTHDSTLETYIKAEKITLETLKEKKKDKQWCSRNDSKI